MSKILNVYPLLKLRFINYNCISCCQRDKRLILTYTKVDTLFFINILANNESWCNFWVFVLYRVIILLLMLFIYVTLHYYNGYLFNTLNKNSRHHSFNNQWKAISITVTLYNLRFFCRAIWYSIISYEKQF